MNVKTKFLQSQFFQTGKVFYWIVQFKKSRHLFTHLSPIKTGCITRKKSARVKTSL